MKHDPHVPGSALGGMLLVAGSCIGAGMLALPILMGLSGFFPSLLMLFLSWALMTFTGLLLVEVNGWFYGQVNLITMAKESLGSLGRWVSWLSYLFLFYCLLIAYSAASGSIFSALLKDLFHFHLPEWIASLFFAAFFGVIIYLGTRPVDLFNRILMAGLIATYFGMIAIGIPHVHPKLLFHFAPKSMFFALPVLVVSFGFQNVIPSLVAYMRGDFRRVRKAIIGGSLLTLCVYLFWAFLLLGIVPFEGTGGILESYQKGIEATHALQTALGSSTIVSFAQWFAFFAVVTSYLAQGLTLTHFLADGLHLSPVERPGRLLTILALGPPLLFALYKPEVFFKALSLAGGIFAMILFGLLPVAMIWIGRYKKKLTSNYHVSGGKTSLILALFFSLFVILCELVRSF